jgi:hypothetical protein
VALSAGALLLAAAGAWAADPVSPGQTVLGFRVPEYDSDGRLKSQISGAQAVVLTNGDIEVSDVCVELYREGRLQTRVKSPKCLYRKAAEMVTSDSPVRIESDSLTITGTGLRWDRSAEKVEILDEVVVILARVREWFEQKQEIQGHAR